MRNMGSNLDGSKLTLTSCLALSVVWQKNFRYGVLFEVAQQYSKALQKARREKSEWQASTS